MLLGGGGGDPIPDEDSCWFTWQAITYYYYHGKSVMALRKKILNPGESLHDVSNEYFIYGAGKQLCQINQDSTGSKKNLFVVSDYQGNVRNLVENYNDAPRVTREYLYGPFGTLDSIWVQAGDTLEARFGYGLKEMDLDFGAGLQYHGARFYEPAVGRFTSVDPIYDYHNPYSYCRNNPIKYIDPSGMSVSKPLCERPIPTPHGQGWWLAGDVFQLSTANRYARVHVHVGIDWHLFGSSFSAEVRESLPSLFGKDESDQQEGTGGNDAKLIPLVFIPPGVNLPTIPGLDRKKNWVLMLEVLADPRGPAIIATAYLANQKVNERGFSGGDADAARHALWSALLTQATDHTYAEYVLVLNEIDRKEFPKELGMEFWNNSVGRNYAFVCPNCNIDDFADLIVIDLASNRLRNKESSVHALPYMRKRLHDYMNDVITNKGLGKTSKYDWEIRMPWGF